MGETTYDLVDPVYGQLLPDAESQDTVFRSTQEVNLFDRATETYSKVFTQRYVFEASTSEAQRYSLRLEINSESSQFNPNGVVSTYEVRIIRASPYVNPQNFPQASRVYFSDLGILGQDIQAESSFWNASNNHQIVNKSIYGLELKTTNQLTELQTRQVSVFATRTLDGRGETRSPVWAVVDLLTNTTYGAGMPESRIDMDSMEALATLLEARGDYFDGYFDRQITVWQAVEMIARVARCKGVIEAGVFRLIRDRQQTVPVQMFSPRNIKQGSFGISYQMQREEENNGIELEWLNTETNQTETVLTKIEGSGADRTAELVSSSDTPPNNPLRVNLFGCTNLPQARREALYLTRNMIYRRITITLDAELEAGLLTLNDLVAVSHDMPGWGTAADVVLVESVVQFGGLETDGGNQSNPAPVFTLNEPLTFSTEAGVIHYMKFRMADGSETDAFEIEPASTITTEPTKEQPTNKVILNPSFVPPSVYQNPFLVFSDSQTAHITLSSGVNFIVSFGKSQQPTQVVFGTSQNAYEQLCVVKSITPHKDGKTFSLVLLNEDNRVHED